MDNRKKSSGISILITIVSIASVSIYLVKNLNIIINPSPKDNIEIVEVTTTPTTSPPVKTNSTDVTTPPEQTNTPTTTSPTEQPTLTVETTDTSNKKITQNIKKYYIDLSDTKETRQ